MEKGSPDFSQRCASEAKARFASNGFVYGLKPVAFIGSSLSPLAAASSSLERMRWRISAAAALVKVMATIWPGSSTWVKRQRKRRGSRSGGGALATGLLIGGLRVVFT